ncbi:MarR family transcriptional regulator [Psychromicrobium xiongbiense]|uniref:MarR family transcriptional regulator n=1 Tax=Psychromicrobium xiongbiense TaxID=3051184 RepID=UPI002557008D|nr:MarR family transcriptional regulator [Psychromicrobium sp. YIM S02556]
MFVLTVDQKSSRSTPDLVPELLQALQAIPTVLAFQRSVGDEIQGLLDDAGATVEAIMLILRRHSWYVGLGIGAVEEPLPASLREARGPAFIAAREAVEQAKKTGNRIPLAVRGSIPTQQTEAAEAVLRLVGRLVSDRTSAEWNVVDRLVPGKRGEQHRVAQELSMTAQAVSGAVQRTGWSEELAGREAATLLLTQAQETINRWS